MSKLKFENLLVNIDLKLNIQYLYEYKGVDIYLLRDDLINFSYGGNKVRLAIELFEDFYKKNTTCILSYGSLESNFNRILADFSKVLGIKCYILSSLKDEEFKEIYNDNRKKCLNEKLCDEAGAERYFCKKTEVREKLSFIMEKLKKEGERPYYIYGNLDGTGNDVLLQKAYFNIYSEIANQTIDFENIVMAYGTGMTFGGMLKAKKENTKKYNLYGISIARDKLLNDDIEKNYIITKYIGDFYGSSNKDVDKLIVNNFSLSLDPIYTGKAFYGLLKEIEEGNIKGKTLFIHTGGYPIFKDFIDEYKTAIH